MFPNASFGAHLKAINVVKTMFRGFSYKHYLYSFLYMKRKHLIHQYLHDYGLTFKSCIFPKIVISTFLALTGQFNTTSILVKI